MFRFWVELLATKVKFLLASARSLVVLATNIGNVIDKRDQIPVRKIVFCRKLMARKVVGSILGVDKVFFSVEISVIVYYYYNFVAELVHYIGVSCTMY